MDIQVDIFESVALLQERINDLSRQAKALKLLLTVKDESEAMVKQRKEAEKKLAELAEDSGVLLASVIDEVSDWEAVNEVADWDEVDDVGFFK